MNKIILLLLLCITIFACSSKTEKTIPEKQLEGWAGNPDNPNEKPFDYFYMMSDGKASKDAHDTKNGEMMKSTCIDASSKYAKSKFIKLILEYHRYLFCKSIQEKDSIRYPLRAAAYYLQPIKDFHLINASDGNCIPQEYIERTKFEIKVNECKPLFADDPDIPYGGWKECECLTYAHVPGGRDAVIMRVLKVERE